MTAPLRTAGLTIYTCDHCGVRFNWGARSSWYGSWRDSDDCRWDRIRFYCGECDWVQPPDGSPPPPPGGGEEMPLEAATA